MTHSPLPWSRPLGTLGRFIVDAGEKPVCDLDYYTLPALDANAALIVHAVNSHDALVKALEEAVGFIEAAFGSTGATSEVGWRPDDNSIMRRFNLAAARAALSAAKQDER